MQRALDFVISHAATFGVTIVVVSLTLAAYYSILIWVGERTSGLGRIIAGSTVYVGLLAIIGLAIAANSIAEDHGATPFPLSSSDVGDWIVFAVAFAVAASIVSPRFGKRLQAHGFFLPPGASARQDTAPSDTENEADRSSASADDPPT